MNEMIPQSSREAELHYGHRERMRKRFMETEGSGMNNHEILEMLLYYSIPRCDTNETAHRLINLFGSLAGVINAPYKSLLAVDGIGSGSAILIKLVGVLINRYNIAGLQSSRLRVRQTEDAIPYLKSLLGAKPEEEMYMLTFRDTGMLIECHTITLGKDSVSMHADTGKCVRIALQNAAAFVIIAHNHPNGVLTPSSADLHMTQHLNQILSSVNITLAEHVLIAGDKYLCIKSYMQSRGKIV